MLEVATSRSEVDSVSDTSTLEWDHEPFETFQARVLKLCETALPSSCGTTSVQRMQGGGFNRIIGISVTSSDAGKHASVEQYILRVLRFEWTQLERDLAPLELLGQRTQIPIPPIQRRKMFCKVLI
jgi:hypothetical protein